MANKKRPLKAACIQTRATNLADYRQTASHILEKLTEAGERGCDLAILPECVYPAYCLGVDDTLFRKAVEEMDALLRKISQMAKEYGMMIGLGIPVEENGYWYNAGLLYGADGELLGQCRKSNLWHYDSKWFAQGEDFQICETPFGKIGMIVCADGRIPEITRILANQGAWLILDFVNLAANARREEELLNQQYEFILPIRAMENGVWLMASDKCGLEDRFVSNLGRSMIISPEGEIVKEASTNREEILYCQMEPSDLQRGWPERRPQEYGILTWPTEELPARRYLESPVNLRQMELFSSAAVFSAADDAEYLEKALEYSFRAGIIQSELLVLPQLAPEFCCVEMAEKISAKMDFNGVVLIGGTCHREGKISKGAIAFNSEKILYQWGKTHLSDADKAKGYCVDAESSNQVLVCPWGIIAVVFDEEMYLPEPARCRTLRGCDILCWYDEGNHPKSLKIQQTRSAENKIFVLREIPLREDDSVTVTNPDGKTVCSSFMGQEQLIGAMTNTALSRSKTVTPGTNIILGRRPESYGQLTKILKTHGEEK